METIKVNVAQHIATITLNRPKSNALNGLMMKELSDILTHIEKDEQIAGVILTGQGNFFSAGLDLIEIYALDAQEIKAFWYQFMQFTQQLVAFKKPFISAINGHSPAGGCVMALASDVRMMAEGEFKIGLNEIPVGIIVPHTIFRLYAFVIGEAKASKYLLTGQLFAPQQALEIGLVDELVHQNNILTQAERAMQKLIQLDGNTWQASKLNIRKELINIFKQPQEQEIEALLEQWWQPKNRAILKTIIDNLKQK